jgi:hypothetical protein
MSIFIRTTDGEISAQVSDFMSEAELEEVVASRPELLTTGDDQPMAFVARQIDLPDAGLLDLLFVSKAGLPVATEVKLAKNGESRRQIVAQIVDYLSSLTSLTVDELDSQVEGALEVALRSFDQTEEQSDDFERRWQAVGANLRAGLARIILVLDALPPDLERIVRFLSEHTNLDIRVVTVTKHEAGAVGTVFVPHVAVVAEGEPAPRPTQGPRALREDLAAVVEAYDRNAPSDLQTHGTASRYRKIRPPEWPTGFKVHYEFTHVRGLIGAELHLENSKAARLGPDLARFSGTKVGPREAMVEWDPKWSSGRGRLMVRYDVAEDPQVVVATMVDLINHTRTAVVDIASRLGNS